MTTYLVTLGEEEDIKVLLFSLVQRFQLHQMAKSAAQLKYIEINIDFHLVKNL